MQCSYRLVENTLASLGMALLVLSMALLPASRAAGDFGCGGGGECDEGYVCENEVCVQITCLADDDCNSGGCVKNESTGNCTLTGDSTICSWSTQGCNGCRCLGCRDQYQTFCDCSCGGSASCGSQNKCPGH